METRTLIEQAKGIIIIAQQHCSPEHASELLSILSQQHRHGHLTASPPDMASHAAAAPARPVSDAVVLWLSSPDWTRPSGPPGLRQTGASGGLLVPLARQQVPQARPFVPSARGT